MTSSSPPPPKTIHDLPLETIGHILTIAHPVDSDDVAEQIARRRFYLDTSLVCRDWTPSAQRALWNYVYLTRKAIEEFVESGGAGRYPIEKLVVHDNRRIIPSIGILLTSVRGVVDLKLHNCIIDASWLAGNNWRGLKSLELEGTTDTTTVVPAYHFALVHLTLVDIADNLSDQTLVALSRQVSITSVELSLDGSASWTLHRLLSLAPQLVRLEMDTVDADDQVAATRGADLFLQQSTQLKHLTSLADNAPSVIHPPSPLDSWTATYCHQRDLAVILDVLKSKAMAISKLQRLCIQPNHVNTTPGAVRVAQSWEGWSEIEEVCRQNKIELRVIASQP